MLAIRLQRTGRTGHAQFRFIVQDSRAHPKRGKVVAYLGSYNPHTKTATVDGEKASQYLEHGAQPSDKVARLFKKEGIKLPAWVELAEPKKRSIRHPQKLRKNRPAEEKPAEPAEVAEPAPEPETEAAVAEEATEATPPEETEAPLEAAAEKPAAQEEVPEDQKPAES